MLSEAHGGGGAREAVDASPSSPTRDRIPVNALFVHLKRRPVFSARPKGGDSARSRFASSTLRSPASSKTSGSSQQAPTVLQRHVGPVPSAPAYHLASSPSSLGDADRSASPQGPPHPRSEPIQPISTGSWLSVGVQKTPRVPALQSARTSLAESPKVAPRSPPAQGHSTYRAPRFSNLSFSVMLLATVTPSLVICPPESQSSALRIGPGAVSSPDADAPWVHRRPAR